MPLDKFNRKTMKVKNKILFIALLFTSNIILGQTIVNNIAKEDHDLDLEATIRKYMYDTLTNRQYSTFEKIAINGDSVFRRSINNKPAFIYTFTTNCRACHIDFVDVFPELLKEFGEKIDFILLTPATEEELKNDEYPYPHDLPVIILPKENFKTGFPMGYLLDKRNNIILIRKGGAGGSNRKQTKKIHCNILQEWFLKVLN